MNTLRQKFLTVVALSLSSCTQHSVQSLIDQNQARIRGYQRVCYGRLQSALHEHDEPNSELLIPAGDSTLYVWREGQPFSPADLSPDTQCVPRSKHQVTFRARAGFTYWFYVFDQNPHSPKLSVYESAEPDSIEGRHVEASTKAIAADRRCFARILCEGREHTL